MPQKKNPDVAEIHARKSARVIGQPRCRAHAVEGLPMLTTAICRRTRSASSNSADTVRACLRPQWLRCSRHERRTPTCAEATASDPTLLATVCRLSRAVRECRCRGSAPHRREVVARAEKKQRALNQLSLAELQSIDETFSSDVLEIIFSHESDGRRNLIGAPGTAKCANTRTLVVLIIK